MYIYFFAVLLYESIEIHAKIKNGGENPNEGEDEIGKEHT